MSKENQIEEMAEVLRHTCEGECFVNKDGFTDCEICHACNLYNAGYRKQSENMVEVIRCKDCVSCEHCFPAKAKGKEATEGWYCNTHKRYVKPDNFCSYAKMKGGVTAESAIKAVQEAAHELKDTPLDDLLGIGSTMQF